MEKETTGKGRYKSSVSLSLHSFSKLSVRLAEKISIMQIPAVGILEIDRNFWQLNQIQVLKWIWLLKRSLMMTMTIAWRPHGVMVPTQKALGRPLVLKNRFLLSSFNLLARYSLAVTPIYRDAIFCFSKFSVINWFTDLQKQNSWLTPRSVICGRNVICGRKFVFGNVLKRNLLTENPHKFFSKIQKFWFGNVTERHMWTENPHYDQITNERSVDVVLIPEVCALGVNSYSICKSCL